MLTFKSWLTEDSQSYKKVGEGQDKVTAVVRFPKHASPETAKKYIAHMAKHYSDHKASYDAEKHAANFEGKKYMLHRFQNTFASRSSYPLPLGEAKADLHYVQMSYSHPKLQPTVTSDRVPIKAHSAEEACATARKSFEMAGYTVHSTKHDGMTKNWNNK